MTTQSDDRHVGSGAPPDPHGHAALLLVESLLHLLVAKSVVTLPEAIETVRVAFEVKEDIAADLGDTITTKAAAIAMLRAIHDSLSIDIPRLTVVGDQPALPADPAQSTS